MTDVQQVLEKRKIPYQLQGQDYKVHCLNPDHDDNNPSMRIDKITGIFNCFSCGFKGDIFSLFEEKVNYLQRQRELFQKKLGLKLAENIGLDIPTNAVKFNRNWRNINGKTFEEFEAFEHNHPDYVGRLVFPIRSISGKIVAFNGRALTPEKTPKYLIKPNGASLPLFPARVTPTQGKVILVEGIFDMLNLWDKGLKNVVCAFGTHQVTKDKLTLLKVQGVIGIDILFDKDEAGEKATEKVIQLAESLELITRTITLPSSMNDPGELTAQQVLKLKEKLYG